MKKFWRGEKGSSLVMTAVVLAAITGFTALAVDGGYLYFKHTQFQDLSDSAALAATAEMAMSSGDQTTRRHSAFQAAVDCAQRNGYQVTVIDYDLAEVTYQDQVGEMHVGFPESDKTKVEVSVSMDVPLFFGRVISISSSMVRTVSAAQFKPPGLVPICFFQGDYEAGVKYDLTLGPGDGAQGNYGYLDFKPSCQFGDYLENGFTSDVDFGNVVETYTGVNVGQVKQAISDRIDSCEDKCSVTETEGFGIVVDVSEDCPRLVLIPVVGGFHEQDGKGYVSVAGFVRFFIDYYDAGTKVLSGWCLGQVGPGAGAGMLGNGFAVREVKLVR